MRCGLVYIWDGSGGETEVPMHELVYGLHVYVHLYLFTPSTNVTHRITSSQCILLLSDKGRVVVWE